MSNHQYPSILEQAKSLGISLHELVGRAMNMQRTIASREAQKERTNICKGCEFFDEEQERCSQCGCFVKYKVAMSWETCPVDKWGADDDTFNQWIEEGAPEEFTQELPLYLAKLPDGSIVPAEEYDKALEEYENELTNDQ